MSVTSFHCSTMETTASSIVLLMTKKIINCILPKQFVQFLAQRPIFCIGQRIAHTEVILLPVMLLRESENIVGCNTIDNFRRSQTVDLLFKDMFQPLLGVRERGFHALALIQALHDFGNVQTRFHVQVNEGLVRVVKAAGIFFFQKRYHLCNGCFRRKDLVRALRRNVVEDVLFVRWVKIVCQLAFQPQELFDGIIEYDFIKQLPSKCFASPVAVSL